MKNKIEKMILINVKEWFFEDNSNGQFVFGIYTKHLPIIYNNT